MLGAIEALKASTLRLPVGGAIVRSSDRLTLLFVLYHMRFLKFLKYIFQADLRSLKEVILSALDVMQALCSSIGSLCMKVTFPSDFPKTLALGSGGNFASFTFNWEESVYASSLTGKLIINLG